MMNLMGLLGQLAPDNVQIDPSSPALPGIMGGMLGPKLPTPPPPPPGVFARLFGGNQGDVNQYGPDAVKSASDQAAIRAGLAMMAAAHQRPVSAYGPPAGFGAALQAGLDAGTQGFQGALQTVRAQQVQKARQDLFGQMQPQANETPEQMYARLSQLYPKVLALGDDALERSFTSYLTHLAGRVQQNKMLKPQQTQTGNLVTTFDPNALNGQGGFWDPQANGGKGAWVPAIERGLSADQKTEDALNRQLKQMQLSQAAQEFTDRQMQTQGKAFVTRNQKILDQSNALMQADQAIQTARTNPAASKSALTNFTQAVDVHPQLRLMVIKYFESIDPSIAGNLDYWVEKMSSGKYPPQQLDEMQAVVRTLQQQVGKTYDRLRTSEIGRNPKVAQWIPTTEEYFASPSDYLVQPISPDGAGAAVPTGPTVNADSLFPTKKR